MYDRCHLADGCGGDEACAALCPDIRRPPRDEQLAEWEAMVALPRSAPMMLSHYSAEPFALDLERTYSQEQFGNGKPEGLWLSVDGEYGWPEWCRDEKFDLHRLEHRTAFTLRPTARILTLTGLDDIMAFTADYGGHPAFEGLELSRHWIHWQRVAEQYDGILITPYCWPARLNYDTRWYYGWDCASGCFWNIRAALTPVDEQVLP